MPERPKMVPVLWKARVHPEDIPHYWQHVPPDEVWWVLSSCPHYVMGAVLRHSTRTGGPAVTPCYECNS